MTSEYSRQQVAEILRSNLVFARQYDLTGEERREVAERLRKASAHRQSISCYAVDKALGLWYDDSYFGSVFASESVLRLADIIDPTCEVESSEYTGMEDEYDFYLSCGHVAEMTCNEPPAYCPECGARITRPRGSRRF